MDIQVLPENARLPIIGQLAAFITRRSIVRVSVCGRAGLQRKG